MPPKKSHKKSSKDRQPQRAQATPPSPAAAAGAPADGAQAAAGSAEQSAGAAAAEPVAGTSGWSTVGVTPPIGTGAQRRVPASASQSVPPAGPVPSGSQRSEAVVPDTMTTKQRKEAKREEKRKEEEQQRLADEARKQRDKEAEKKRQEEKKRAQAVLKEAQLKHAAATKKATKRAAEVKQSNEAAFQEVMQTIDPEGIHRRPANLGWEMNDWSRDITRLLGAIMLLESLGYQVELNVYMDAYAIFAGEARLATHVGYLCLDDPIMFGFYDEMGGRIEALPFQDIRNLPNLAQGGAAPTHSIVPGTILSAGNGRWTVVEHPLLNRCNFTVIEFAKTKKRKQHVYYKAGQLFGTIERAHPDFIVVTEDMAPYIYLDELEIVYRPEQALAAAGLAAVPVAAGGLEYLAFFLPRLQLSAVWQVMAGTRRMKFLGFVDRQPNAINLEEDYYCTLACGNDPRRPDYPMGLPLFPYRRCKKPFAPVERRPDHHEPTAFQTILRDFGVEADLYYSREDGMFTMFENMEAQGGLVYETDTNHFYAWDGVRNYLRKHLTIGQIIISHTAAKRTAAELAEKRKRIQAQLAKDRQAQAEKASKAFTKRLAETAAQAGSSNAAEANAAPVPVRNFKIIDKAFGKDTWFVAEENSQASVADPRTWPLTRRQDVTDGQYRLNDASGNIEVRHDPASPVESGRFYNKSHQRMCYTTSVSEVSGALSLPLPAIIWEYNSDKLSEGVLRTAFGYNRKQADDATSQVVDEFDLSKRNHRKLITERDGKKYYLCVLWATDKEKPTFSGKNENERNLLAVGAANRSALDQYDITGIEGHSDQSTGLVIVNGMKVEKILIGASADCKTADSLARTIESYHESKMWKLTRDINETSASSLPMWDIGIRAMSGDVSMFAGDKSKAEKDLLSKFKLIRCFVALVPDDQDEPQNEDGKLRTNVVSVQDVHPVEGELHIVYLLHHKGNFFSQQIYSNVILVHVQLSQNFIERFVNLYSNPAAEIESGTRAEAEAKMAIKARGYYNQFWKNVCDPTKEADQEQAGLYRRWQHFYQHDFICVNYLASPVNTYEPEQIHVVRVVELLRKNRDMNLSYIGKSENRGEKVFLSGAFDVSQSYIGAPFVEYRNFMVQVEVPDERIQCVIYDFKGMEEYLGFPTYDGESEAIARKIFSEMANLTKDQDSNIPQRLYFSRINVSGSIKEFSLEKSRQQEDPQGKILCPATGETEGCIQLNLFYFVSHIGIEHVKVGVANVPFNCRSFVTHHESLCKNVLEYSFKASDRKSLCKDYEFPDEKKIKSDNLNASTSRFPMRGCLWREGQKPIVGIIDGRNCKQYLGQASLFKTSNATKTTVAFLSGQGYSQGLVMQHTLDSKQGFNENDKATVYANIPENAHHLELTHHVRQISAPIFDVEKGYPVHGFYRLNSESVSASLPDPVFGKLMDNFYAFWMDDEHPKTQGQKANLEVDFQRWKKQRLTYLGAAGNSTDQPQVANTLCSLVSILSASAALYLFL
ncbi:hypothetical protein HDE_03530 [Halotydeus destructor]|nr:hypothetical protein HDE_03530 [Halotydeus destructor]